MSSLVLVGTEVGEESGEADSWSSTPVLIRSYSRLISALSIVPQITKEHLWVTSPLRYTQRKLCEQFIPTCVNAWRIFMYIARSACIPALTNTLGDIYSWRTSLYIIPIAPTADIARNIITTDIAASVVG